MGMNSVTKKRIENLKYKIKVQEKNLEKITRNIIKI
jgi:hypothetical protein